MLQDNSQTAGAEIVLLFEDESCVSLVRTVIESTGQYCLRPYHYVDLAHADAPFEGASLVIVSIEPCLDRYPEYLDTVFNLDADLPILMNDPQVTRKLAGTSLMRWQRQFIEKLHELVPVTDIAVAPVAESGHEFSPGLDELGLPPETDISVDDTAEGDSEYEIELPETPSAVTHDSDQPTEPDLADKPVEASMQQETAEENEAGQPDRQYSITDDDCPVWLFAASIGGPEALRQFLAEFEDKPNCAMILVQHIGQDFIDLMTQQLSQSSQLDVRLIQTGQKMTTGVVHVTPVGVDVSVDAHGRFVLTPETEPGIYKPCIDRVAGMLLDRFPGNINAIYFSGMSSDGVDSASTIASQGGQIWTQDPGSCVVSSIVDGVHKLGLQSFTGTPTDLAIRFIGNSANKHEGEIRHGYSG